MKQLLCSFTFVLSLGATARATPAVVYSNFGPGDSVANSIHDVLNQQAYAEHAARFFVPMGTNITQAIGEERS